MMDLFELMGVPSPKPEEKPTKKEAKKKEAKKKNTKEETLYSMVDIDTGFGHWIPELGTGKRYSEIASLFQKEYPGSYGLYEYGPDKKLRVMQQVSAVQEPNTKVPAGTLIAFGSYQMTTQEETTFAEALEMFSNQFPEFEACSGTLVKKDNTLMIFPFIVSLDNEPEIKFPVTIGFGNDTVVISEIPENADYKTVMKETYEKRYAAAVSAFHYCETVNRWLPVYEMGKKVSYTETAAKKEEKKYPLPITIRFSLQTLTITKEHFPNQNEITAEEAREFLQKQYFEYTKERTVMEWNETHNCLIAILKSSSKGSVRIEDLEFAEFVLDEKNRRLLEFQYKLPPIPETVLIKAIEIGRNCLPLESALQLFWNHLTKEYFLFYPKQRATSGSVTFERESALEYRYHLIADIHTHGCASAYFSRIDDYDELGWRLYLVLGRLDRTLPEACLRVGANGCFKKLPIGDYFRGKQEVYIRSRKWVLEHTCEESEVII